MSDKTDSGQQLAALTIPPRFPVSRPDLIVALHHASRSAGVRPANPSGFLPVKVGVVERILTTRETKYNQLGR